MVSKSIILVGNGRSLKDSNLGEKIDSFDEVVRFNNINIIGFEKDVGSKTNILITYNPEKKFYKFIKDYRNKGMTKEDISKLVKDVKEIWYLSPVDEHLIRSWNFRLFNIIGLGNTIKRYESIKRKNEIAGIVRHPTTGFIAINIYLDIYDKIYLVGFDFGNLRTENTNLNHYFSESQAIITSPHDVEIEYAIVRQLVKDGRIVFLDKDTPIEKSNQILEPNESLICSNCNKTSLKYSWERKNCNYCEKDI